MPKRTYTNQNEKGATSIHTNCKKILVAILFVFLIAVVCHAGEITNVAEEQSAPEKKNLPTKENIAKDVSELKDLYDTIIPVGASAPSFVLKDLNGQVWNADAFLKKDLTLLYFWSVFCPYCKENIPNIGVIYEKFKGRGLKVLAVNVDGADENFTKAIKAFLVDSKINYPAPLDELYKNQAGEFTFFHAADPYGVSKTPTLFLIDTKGKIIYEAEVNINYEELGKLIEKNLSNIKSKIIIILISVAVIFIISIVAYLLFINPKVDDTKL